MKIIPNFFKNPCPKCLVNPACVEGCDTFYQYMKYHRKYLIFVDSMATEMTDVSFIHMWLFYILGFPSVVVLWITMGIFGEVSDEKYADRIESLEERIREEEEYAKGEV